MGDIIRYPRTLHIRGSRKTGDDFELEDVSFEEALQGKYVVYEAKIDGSNCAVSFEDSRMILQSRGHELRGGPREREFQQLRIWANRYQHDLFDILGNRYIFYAENMFAKHTVFYDNLPHWIFEFDIFDKERRLFLSTKARRRLLEGLEYVAAPVVYEGTATTLEHLKSFIGRSAYKTDNWKENLGLQAERCNYDVALAIAQTDQSDLDEGIYIKVETEEETVGRYKFVRDSFTNSILNQGSHWHDRTLIPNQLADSHCFKL